MNKPEGGEGLHGWLPLTNEITEKMAEAGEKTLGATILKGSHREVAIAVYRAMREAA
jgi:hypothetical protein